jgi:hypothetical protein
MKTLISCLLVAAGALVLLYPVYINDYPLVYSDTGTYIDSGFRSYVPDDRPIMYGLLIRHSSLATSLFLAVLFQGLLISGVIYASCRLLVNGFGRANYTFAACIYVLSLCTGLPWIAAWIMPDVYTGVSFLLLVAMLFGKELPAWRFGLLAVVYYIITLTHLSNMASHLLLVMPLLIVALCVRPALRERWMPLRRTAVVTAMVALNVVLLPSLNFLFKGGFVSSRGSSVFMSARLCGYGLLQEYLDNNCDHKQYRICAYKDSLPHDGGRFLWDYSGPLYKLGGWKEMSPELGRINRAILTDPAYLRVFAENGLRYTWKQLFLFKTGVDYEQYDTTSAPYGAIAWHLKNERELMLGSLQNTGRLNVSFYMLHIVQSGTLLVCLILSGLLMFVRPFHKTDMAVLAALILMVANAAICAFLSDAGSRYQARVIWIFPMLTILQLVIKKDQLIELSGRLIKRTQRS